MQYRVCTVVAVVVGNRFPATLDMNSLHIFCDDSLATLMA